jgi:hypothetical protein
VKLTVNFARRVFWVSGVYGFLILGPQYFMEGKINVDNPPAITHAEYFYGFIGVGRAWQFLFLVIARDPVRYRLAILPAILENSRSPARRQFCISGKNSRFKSLSLV